MDRDDFLPEGWEVVGEHDGVLEIETEWGTLTFYRDVDEAREEGFDQDAEEYRGLFFSLEDAEEYAMTIGLPVVFIETEWGIEVYIDYKGD